jgi:hypothetical protein
MLEAVPDTGVREIALFAVDADVVLQETRKRLKCLAERRLALYEEPLGFPDALGVEAALDMRTTIEPPRLSAN